MFNFTVYELRQALGYKGLAAFVTNWRTVHGRNTYLEDDNVLPQDDVCTFLRALTKPQKGRSKKITDAAIALLSKMECCEESEQVQIPLVQNMEPVTVTEPQLVQPIGFNVFGYVKSLTTLEVAFGFVCLLANYGFITLLAELGLIVAVVYTAIAIHAIRMAGNRYAQQTAQYGFVAIIALECVAFFVHLAMFNRAVWNAYSDGKMPFRIEEGWAHLPFIIALVIAALVSLAAIYSVAVSLQLTKEKSRAEEYEQQTGLKW